MQKISIITVNFNNASGLKKTIESVVKQTYHNIEFIIIDGNSCDGSKEIISKYNNNIAYWISEKDNGIYDAMNKGIAKAKGDYLLFLNSGDYLKNKNSIQQIISKGLNADIEVFRQKYDNGRLSPIIKREDINPSYFITSVFPHQSTFIKTELMQKIGGYRTEYKIVSDWIFWFEAVIKQKCSLNFNNKTFSIMEKDGISSDIKKCRNEMDLYLCECMRDGWISWNDIFPISTKARKQDYCKTNIISFYLNKIAIWIGKRWK